MPNLAKLKKALLEQATAAAEAVYAHPLARKARILAYGRDAIPEAVDEPPQASRTWLTGPASDARLSKDVRLLSPPTRRAKR